MATLEELDVKIDELGVKVAAFGPAINSLEQTIKDALASENISPATQAKIDAAFAKVGGIVDTAQAALDDAATQDAEGN